MGKKYLHPPLVEAVCEFRPSPDTKWDLTMPGRIYKIVEKDFPITEQHLAQETEINQGSRGIQQSIRTSERVWFLTENRKMFVQVGPNFLAINSLKPYPTWEDFKPRIVSALKALMETVKVKGFERIGLRYVNRVEIPMSSRNLMDIVNYFEFRPLLGPRLPQKDLANFLLKCNLAFLGGQDFCSVHLANVIPENEGHAAFLLDFDYFLGQPKTMSFDSTLDWVETAHQHVEEVFEGCMTDKLRKMFEEKK